MRLRLLQETLVYLTCGRSGCGLEIPLAWEVRLVRADFSVEAIHQARQQSRRLGAEAGFRVGDLASTRLDAVRPRPVVGGSSHHA